MSTAAHTGIHGRRPALITDAGMSRQEEFELRRRRYGRLMIGRVVCIIAAFVVGSVWSNIWLAGVFIAFAAVLPWAAVLIANDRLPLAAAERRADRHAAPAAVPQLTASTTPAERTEHRVIEG